MRHLLPTLLILCAGIVAHAQFPSPIACDYGIDNAIAYGNAEILNDFGVTYGQAAAHTDDKDTAARFKAIEAELCNVAGQPEKALQIYMQLIQSFDPAVAPYTRASIMCAAVQAAIGLGYVNDILPYIADINNIIDEIGPNLESSDNLILYWKLTSVMMLGFLNDPDAIAPCTSLTYEYLQKYGSDSPQFAFMEKMMGDLHYNLDHRSQAQFYYIAALGTWDDSHPNVGQFALQISLAAIYCELSDFKSAKYHIAQAETILSQTGLMRSYHGILLSEIKCTYYTLTESYPEVLKECAYAEKLSDEIFGPGHFAAKRLIPCKAVALVWTDQMEQAFIITNNLVGQQDMKFGLSRLGSDYLNALSVWSMMASSVDADAVINTHMEAEREIINACPRKHSLIYNFYESWGIAHWLKKEYKASAEKYRRSLLSSRNSLHSSLNFLSEKDRAQLINDVYRYHDNIYNLGTAPTGNRDVAALMFDNALFTKGVMLQSVTSLKHQVEMLPDSATEAHRLLDNFLALKQKRARGERVYDFYLSQAEINLLHHLEEHPEYGDYLQFLNTEWSDISACLDENDVAIEFVSSDSWRGERYFSAEVLRRGRKPEHVRLFTIKDVDKHLLNTDRGQFNQFVRDSIWTAELRSRLPKGGNVYFVPTAELYGMALEYIPVGEDAIPMCDLYNMVRLSSTRQLTTDFADRAIGDDFTAAIYGGLNYNTSLDDMELYALEASERGIRGTSLWQMLPGTAQEAKNVAQALANHDTRLYMGDDGVEETFKALDRTRTSIVHIATHGFYTIGDNDNPDSALDRTGLIMAGANNFWLSPQAPKDIDDGVLTAREISDLDLRGTDIVVLSACQTGLGDITGEGVYGLQRAFKMAGAQSILMSLWPVNDEATQVLMSEFYRYLAQGLTKRQALAAARAAVAGRTFIIDGAEHPGSDMAFWAAFVMLD